MLRTVLEVGSDVESAKPVSKTLALEKGSTTEGKCQRENMFLDNEQSSAADMPTIKRQLRLSTSSDQSTDQSYPNCHCVAVVVTNEHTSKADKNYPINSITNLPTAPPNCGSSRVDSQTENACTSVSDPSSECDTTNCQINNEPCITTNLSHEESELGINVDISCHDADLLKAPQTVELGGPVRQNELNEDIEIVDNHSIKDSSDNSNGDGEPLCENIPDSNIANSNSDMGNITNSDNTDNNMTSDIGGEEMDEKLSYQDIESTCTDENV